MPRFYILDKHGEPKPVDDVLTWAAWLEQNHGRRRIAFDKLGDIEVSTVFVGLDSRFDEKGPPLIFETMIFGGEHDEWQARAATRSAALTIHEEAVALVRSAPTPIVLSSSS